MNLYAHQKQIVDEDKKQVGIFTGTGTGKTKTALLLARGKTLIICPKTQKEDRNWEREIEKINFSLPFMGCEYPGCSTMDQTLSKYSIEKITTENTSKS